MRGVRSEKRKLPSGKPRAFAKCQSECQHLKKPFGARSTGLHVRPAACPVLVPFAMANEATRLGPAKLRLGGIWEWI